MKLTSSLACCWLTRSTLIVLTFSPKTSKAWHMSLILMWMCVLNMTLTGKDAQQGQITFQALLWVTNPCLVIRHCIIFPVKYHSITSLVPSFAPIYLGKVNLSPWKYCWGGTGRERRDHFFWRYHELSWTTPSIAFWGQHEGHHQRDWRGFASRSTTSNEDFKSVWSRPQAGTFIIYLVPWHWQYFGLSQLHLLLYKSIPSPLKTTQDL